VKHEYNLETLNKLPNQVFDALILGVAHQEFQFLNFKSLQKKNAILYDVKGFIDGNVDGRL
jgi:UDP-N-acetyl-D-galactosamine dehydrogenase